MPKKMPQGEREAERERSVRGREWRGREETVGRKSKASYVTNCIGKLSLGPSWV